MHEYWNHKVRVFSFECFDVNLDAPVVPPFKATEEAIRKRFHGTPHMLTGELVDPSELDSEGRWFRVATGWGLLTPSSEPPRDAYTCVQGEYSINATPETLPDGKYVAKAVLIHLESRRRQEVWPDFEPFSTAAEAAGAAHIAALAWIAHPEAHSAS